ncbi:RNase H domain-containing protein [Trichonephila clavipes]|uniref:RNase H domain-containing protein n=1 Tax=Trichonephila clavipes TaxID=2585209 RepID=A0A8X6VRF5_TRICX|nr:RNase H domain-containing protein [Trichonephila clavipes]
MLVFSAEVTAILVALQHILVSDHRQIYVYPDSMSALESLHSLTDRRHPTVMEILLFPCKLERKGFDVVFCWAPGHVDVPGNELVDNALSDYMQQPVCYQDSKTSFTAIYLSCARLGIRSLTSYIAFIRSLLIG